MLDAQYFGLAQRRKRVFIVGCLGDVRRAAQVLFESESVCGDSPPSRSKRQDIAGTIESRTTGGGFPGTDGACDGHVVSTILSNGDAHSGFRDERGLIGYTLGGIAEYKEGVGTLRRNGGDVGGGQRELDCESVDNRGLL